MKKPIPEKIDLTAEEADKLIERIRASSLCDEDKKIVTGVVHFCLWLQVKLLEAKISIHKLSKFFGIRSEKRSNKKEHEDSKEGTPQISTELQPEADQKLPQEETTAENVPERKLGKNKGRLPANQYSGATKIEVEHPSLSSGDLCPLPLCDGRVYKTEPGSIIRVIGGKMAEAKHYVLEKLRCNLCGALFSAELPTDAGPDKYDARFKSTLAVHKYFLGLPFYRMERMQSYLGVPLPDSTQWQLVEQVADAVYPIFYYLEYLAAQGKAVFLDDTGVKIIAVKLALKNNLSIKRRGTFTTGIIAHVGNHKIYLFYSSQRHAGENANNLLKKRNEGLEKILYMCDGLPSNIPDFEVILINCMSHARREFIDLESYYPQECAIVIKSLASIYKHDKYTKEQSFSDQERLQYHQLHSKPIMDELKVWAQTQFKEGLVEPNSNLGRAINYMLKRWDNLTRFLEVPGAALDNNCCEEILKIPIRVRKNASFFATVHGAFVGGLLTSIMVTAARAGVNPIEYLTALQEHKAQVLKAPQNWLPWNYEASLLDQAPTPAMAA